MSDTLTKLAYQTVQQGKSYFGLVHKAVSTQLLNMVAPAPIETKPKPAPLSLALIQTIQKRMGEILETDWQDAERGVYPASLLFDNSWDDFFRYYPAVWLDMPEMWQRVNHKRYQDFDPSIETQGLPSYYVQNFHHQTNGYLTDESANLYDLQVELLFNGTADPMRRRVLAPLKEGLKTFSDVLPHQIKILDMACGTGRTLRNIRGMLPKASLYGIDLSTAYLRKANQLLSQVSGTLPQLVEANAEELPYLDNYFHAATSVFLFHELPAQARQNVINEAFRVVKPGGTFIICDSVQLTDSPELAIAMENFPEIFHEPYYRHYMTDDLVKRMTDAGFTNVSEQVHFMSKYLVAKKPVAPLHEDVFEARSEDSAVASGIASN